MKLLKFLCVALFTFLGVFTIFSAQTESKNHSGNFNFNSSAKKDFANNCARCHGIDGRGETELGKLYGTPDMTDRKWQKARSGKRMLNSVQNGRGSMPAFGKKLSAAQINGLIGYIRSLRK